jgi:ubiquinone biosynthesis monooxygenase Coq7
MRVNHTGEVSAQALYHGQARTARDPQVRANMEQSASEEQDHLAWCARRIDELGGHTSYLDPVWYAGSFAIGATAGLLGDSISLGFVAETERQVVEHLEGHMKRLPATDTRSRAVVRQMQEDERKHGETATHAGAISLPGPIRRGMRLAARVMTTSAYWL